MTKKTSRGKNFNKKVQQIVREELQDELENKVAVVGAMQQPFTAAIPVGDVLSSTNFIKLLPLIQQGDGQYNSRVGNEIRLKSLDIKMLLQYRDGAGEDDYKDQSLGIRVMILRQKDDNTQEGALGNFQGDKLLENGAVVTAGPGPFSGGTINLLQKINREQFAVRYDKVHYIDRSRFYNSLTDTFVFNKPSRPTVISHKMTFGKNGLKLTYGNGASESPTNFPYFMVIGMASTFINTSPSSNIVNYTYSSNADYTDA